MEKHIYLEKSEVYKYPMDDNLFAPSKINEEYPFDDISLDENRVYDMVRNCFVGMGLDKEHFGEKTWNPLGVYINPGDVVVIKPNMVKHCESTEQYQCTVTNPSIVRAVIDYCVIAKAGKIILGDAPIQGADMDKIKCDCKYDDLIDYYLKKGINIQFKDFRDLVVKRINQNIVTVKEKKPNSDDYVNVSLGNKSKHYQPEMKTKYETCGYVNTEINKMHNKEKHDYVISSDILAADVIINLPKPKTHRFAGLTAAQKNFVGSCSDKESLPHFRAGGGCVGGDETNKDNFYTKCISWNYAKSLSCDKKKQYKIANLYRFIYRVLCKLKNKNVYIHGQWYGNDTIWRTIIDLNKIMYFADKTGNMKWGERQRKILTIGDMIIAGEKEGPLNPSPKPLGMVLISDNCALFDYVVCKIAGFDEKVIPTVHHSIRNTDLSDEDWQDIVLFSNHADFNEVKVSELDINKVNKWEPHPFWKEVL